MNGIISSAHKDMNAEAHISEILDSDAEDEIEKERSQERDSAQQRKVGGDIWSQADFWNKPIVKKPEPKPVAKTTNTVKPKEPE